jgi:predicted TIM-barrel fold metal-dependent hydrolase
VNRRRFLGAAAGAVLPLAAAEDIPIIDTHIHLFDTRRPGGVPWPPKNDTALYMPALPDRYRKIALPLGIRGAIEVEASPLIEDTQWVLDIAAHEPLLVGTVGHLEPGEPDFAKQLERFHRNPLFRGIRYGNLWGRDLGIEMKKPGFISGLKLLAGAGLVLDSANPTPQLIATMLRVTDLVPNLRVVMDHLPRLENPPEHDLRELGSRPEVFAKISGVVRKVNGSVPEDLAVYRPTLDLLYGIFGPDRVLYGSDWPNSDHWAPYEVELKIVRAYFGGKGRSIAEKYFWKNSVAAYRWIKREPNQPA